MRQLTICLSAFLFLAFSPGDFAALAQSKPGACDEQLKLSHMGPTMIAKGRLQDYSLIPAVKRILHLGKRAVPLLIACLTDERTTKLPVFNFWARTTVGDVAFVFLNDLFLDSSGQHTTLKGVITFRDVSRESAPSTPYWVAWSNYIAKHGRQHIQEVWLKEWVANQNEIYWDESERCFRVNKKP